MNLPEGFEIDAPQSRGAIALDPRARELAIRTVLGEAADQPDEGMAGVAGVIRNRLESGRFGKSVPEVVLARSQFEPWMTQSGRSRMMGYVPESEPYRRAAAAVDAIFNATRDDPTQGATHFFSPRDQAALGRQPPAWANGQQPLVIGGHNFYAPEGRVNSPTAALPSSADPAGGALAFAGDGAGQPAMPAGAPVPLPRPRPVEADASAEDIDNPSSAYNRSLLPPAAPEASPAAGGLPAGFVLDEGPAAPAASARPPAPIIGYPEHYREARQAAGSQIDRGIEQLRNVGDNPLNALWGAGNVGLGAVGAVASPINAAYRNIVGQPIENLTGIPKEYTEFAAQLATPGLGLTKLGATRVPVPPSAGQQVAQAAERLSSSGAEVTVPRALASDRPAVQGAAQYVRNIPVGGSPVIQATERSLGQLGTKADEVAAGYGGASVPGAGGVARQSIVDWVGPQSKASVSKAYDAVDNAINPSVTTDLTKTQGVAADIMARRMASGDASAGKAVDAVTGAITRPGGLTYQGIKDLRSRIGEMLDTGILPEGWSGKELKRIYGSLTEDLGQAVENAGGPRAKALWERANRYTAMVNDRREALAKIVGSDGGSPAETVFDRLSAMASSSSRADIARLAQARKVMGTDEWNDVASAVVGRLGRDAEGNFSPARFVTDWGKVSDAGKNLLFRSGGKSDLAQNLDDIATISSRWKDNYQKFGNPSGTARNLSFGALGAGLIAEPVTTISTVVGARAMATMLSRPATAAAAAAFTRRYAFAVRSPTPAGLAALTTSARNLANTVNSQLGLSTKADDFLRAIQGGVPGRAEDEQQ